MDKTLWDVLGIEATADERAIKRAYATRLKVTSPEADAAGYMKLRAAYESAKNYALMQQRLALSPEMQPAEQPDIPTATRTPGASELNLEESTASLQRHALAELQVLLAQHDLASFLQKVEAMNAAQTFATLDEQYYFVGEVASLIQEFQIQDTEWCGRLAALLGAREHENIFPVGTRYWFAYNALLRSYAELRAVAAQAHVEDQSRVSVTPGYLHVYHVLTAPFDAERLSALTRSQRYHRLAEGILERAKSDPTIDIPTENREWWERTAMAGQHRPTAEPMAVAAPQQASPKTPFWAVWLLLLLLVQVGRACTGPSPGRVTLSPDEIQRYVRSTPLIVTNGRGDMQEMDTALNRGLALCDAETRRAILMHLRISQANQGSSENGGTSLWYAPIDSRPFAAGADATNSSSGASTGTRPAEPFLDTSDPIVTSLLEKCQASRLFDDDGMLRELPR